jgi:hypothetical protein
VTARVKEAQQYAQKKVRKKGEEKRAARKSSRVF